MPKEDARKARERNKRRTKEARREEMLKMYEMEENTVVIDDIKRRANITINEVILTEIEKITNNKSGLIEKLLIKEVEKALSKKIIVWKG